MRLSFQAENNVIRIRSLYPRFAIVATLFQSRSIIRSWNRINLQLPVIKSRRWEINRENLKNVVVTTPNLSKIFKCHMTWQEFKRTSTWKETRDSKSGTNNERSRRKKEQRRVITKKKNLMNFSSHLFRFCLFHYFFENKYSRSYYLIYFMMSDTKKKRHWKLQSIGPWIQFSRRKFSWRKYPWFVVLVLYDVDHQLIRFEYIWSGLNSRLNVIPSQTFDFFFLLITKDNDPIYKWQIRIRLIINYLVICICLIVHLKFDYAYKFLLMFLDF